MRALVLVAMIAACRGDTPPNEERKIPHLQPGPFEIPADLRIEVVVDGAVARDIDAARLRATAADFADKDRHAWRLDTLLASELAGRRAKVTGAGGTGAGVVVELPGKERVPVLLLNRRGHALLTLVDPANPFPRFHGEGGRLARPGHDQPQLIVQRLEVQTTPP